MSGLLSQLPTAIVIVLLFRYFLRDVSRTRLERFALRQDLVITRSNGALVIRYLAATRRWRVAGFVAGSVVGAGWNYSPHMQINAGWAGPFVGWFVGASVAEWQLGRGDRDGLRRAALLVVRRFTDYLGQSVVVGVAVGWLLLAALEADVVVTASSGRFVLIAVLVLSAVAAAGQYLVARHVLLRPQALAAPDVLAADDAIRSRSLHVLAGSSLVIAAMLGMLTLHNAAAHVSWVLTAEGNPIVAIGTVVIPLVGILVSVLPTRARRPRWAPAVGISA